MSSLSSCVPLAYVLTVLLCPLGICPHCPPVSLWHMSSLSSCVPLAYVLTVLLCPFGICPHCPPVSLWHMLQHHAATPFSPSGPKQTDTLLACQCASWAKAPHPACVRAVLQVLLFLEELASVILTPFMLFYTLPQCAGGRATSALIRCCACLQPNTYVFACTQNCTCAHAHMCMCTNMHA